MLSDGYKFKTCYDIIKITTHSPSTEVECVAPLCPDDQLSPPCGIHPFTPAVGVVSCLRYLLLVVVDVNIVSLLGVHNGLETEGDTPHTSHGNCCEHS